MTAVVTSILALLQSFLPLIASSENIAKIIVTLIQIIPIVVKEAQDLVQPIKNIIAALKMDPNATVQQIADLEALDAKVDADFEAAATAALAEDAKP